MIYCVECGVEVTVERSKLSKKYAKRDRVCKDVKACKLRVLESDIEDVRFDISTQKVSVSAARKEFRMEVKALVRYTRELERLTARKVKFKAGCRS